MKVLAIDPGFGRCGVAVLEKNGGREKLLYSECVETSGELSFPERLVIVVCEVERLVHKHKPDAIALERLFFNMNQKTAMHVAETRGALLYVAEKNGVRTFEYTPGQVKIAAAGHGGALKQDVERMVRALVRIEKAIRHDDEFDAIAVGITHLAHARS